jgi:DNA-binding HxlR family transcriptional regulator
LHGWFKIATFGDEPAAGKIGEGKEKGVKGQRTALSESRCAMARALDVIGDWWSLLIVREALYGKRRFNEFQKTLGLAKNILTTRLRKLVECGVMTTVPAPDNGAYNEYVLTEKGEKLYIVMIALQQWGAEFCFGEDEHPITMVDSVHEAPLPAIQLRAQDDRVLGPRDIRAVDKPRKAKKRVVPDDATHAEPTASAKRRRAADR